LLTAFGSDEWPVLSDDHPDNSEKLVVDSTRRSFPYYLTDERYFHSPTTSAGACAEWA
jgi:hypothetical protein